MGDCRLMKQRMLLLPVFFMYVCLSLTAQVPWGVGHESASRELAYFDEEFGRYYQVYPVQMNEKSVFCGKITSREALLQVQLYDDKDNLVFTEISDTLSKDPFVLYFSQMIKVPGVYKLLISTRDPGVKASFSLDQYLFTYDQYFFDAKYNICERTAFVFNHATTGFLFLKRNKQGITETVIADGTQALVAGNPLRFENMVHRGEDQPASAQVYIQYLSSLRTCLPAEFWDEKSEQKFLEGKYQSTLHTFSLKPQEKPAPSAKFVLLYKRNETGRDYQVIIQVLS